MRDYTRELPKHIERYIGENDLFLEIYNVEDNPKRKKRPPILFVHGAYSGSWMWSKYIPQFISEGYTCYAMNMRGHYKSRVQDMTRVSFYDYVEDIKEVIEEIGEPPIVIGHSMGGLLGQKVAESTKIAGLIPLDSSMSLEVCNIIPYKDFPEIKIEVVVPAPEREEYSSIDESHEDILFQRKYLTLDSSKAFLEFYIPFGGRGVSVDSSLIKCPCLVIKAVNCDDDNMRGAELAKYLKAEYIAFQGMTHTGVLIGQRYMQVVDRIVAWLERF